VFARTGQMTLLSWLVVIFRPALRARAPVKLLVRPEPGRKDRAYERAQAERSICNNEPVVLEKQNSNIGSYLSPTSGGVRGVSTPRSRRDPVNYLVLGGRDDRKGYTTAVRAFALAGKLGDHLILIGYGKQRRRLEAWARSLGIDATVTFRHPDVGEQIDLTGVDVVIVVSHASRHISRVIMPALAKGVRIICSDRNGQIKMVIGNQTNVSFVEHGDVLNLCLTLSNIKVMLTR